MAERSSITQAVQIGVEVTPGTAVAAPRSLGSIGFQLAPAIETNNNRPLGQKYPSLAILGKEWSEAEIEGTPVYTELPYIFASLLTTPTITPILDGATPTGATRWEFNPLSRGDDNPKTLTVEQGSAVRAHKAAYGLISELEMAWSREEIELEGTLIARRIQDGITLTAGATMLPQVPVRPTELSVYLDDVHTDLGTTKQTRAIAGEFNLGGDRYQPVWVVDAAQPSFVAHVEGEPDFEFTVTQMTDAQGMENLVAMRAGTTRFLRLHAVGPEIYDGGVTVNHELIIDVAGQVSDVEFDDEDGIHVVEWTFTAVHDATWNAAVKVEIVTTTSAL